MVIIRGDVRAADLRQLERACGPAFDERRLRPEVVVRGGTILDSAARACLSRLEARILLASS